MVLDNEKYWSLGIYEMKWAILYDEDEEINRTEWKFTNPPSNVLKFGQMLSYLRRPISIWWKARCVNRKQFTFPIQSALKLYQELLEVRYMIDEILEKTTICKMNPKTTKTGARSLKIIENCIRRRMWMCW